MADNVALPAAAGKAATREVTYSGEAAQAQAVGLVAFSGSDDAKTAVDLPGDATDGLLVNLGTNNDVVCTATDLDIRNLVQATDKVGIGDGTNLIDIDVAPTDGEANGGKRLLHTESWLWGFNGTSWDRLRSDTTNGLDVDVTRVSGNVTVVQNTAGSLNCTEASASAIKTAVELLDDAVIADDAAFTPATTKLHMSGFTLDNTSTDVIDEGDAGAARITSDRRQIVALGESGSKFVKGGGSKTDTTAQSLMAASGDAAISNYLGWVTVYNSSATNTAVEIRDGTTTVVAVIPAPAYGGAVFQPTYPIKGTANTAFNAYSQASVSTIHVYGGGYAAV